MQLVEEGKLDLDVDVNEYLDFEIPSQLEYGSKRQELRPITIRHLMTHTDRMSQIFTLQEEELLPLYQYIRQHRPARVFSPGEVTAYSNYGTTLAGYIVEVVSGIPFAQYVKENIYRPLQMKNSSFRQPLPENLANNMSKPYRYVDGEFREEKFEFMSESAGSMSSSASDMANFMLAYLQSGQLNGESILMEETVAKIFSEQFTPHPRLDGMAHGFIKTTFNDRDAFHHPGGTMLYDTGLYLLPEEQVGFFISHSGGNYLVNIEIFQSFMDRYFPHEGITVPQAPEDMAQRAREYVGEYHQNRRALTTVDKFLSLLIGVIHVDVDDEGFLLVSHLGETNKFVEIEPGVYHNLREGRTHDYGGDFRTIVFSTDPMGKTMLMADGPMSYSRAAWYETSGVFFSMLILPIVFIVGSLLYWGVKHIILKVSRKRVHSKRNGTEEKWSKPVAIIHGLFTLVFVTGFIMEGEIDPVYGLPASAYSKPSALSSLFDLVPYAMTLLSVAIVILAVKAWWKKYWGVIGRIHYTLFALASVISSWIFYFWNVL
ncbi:MAG: serine hydrolase [Clostridiaceae bacterium]|nr:serine hydrolase [Clostridiaceae bacterium]